MINIDIFFRLKLPLGKEQCDACKADLQYKFERHEGIEQFVLFNDGEEQTLSLSFSFTGEMNLDELTDEIERTGAFVLQQFIQLPSMLTGMADADNPRSRSTVVSKTLCSIEGVKNATVSTQGIARIECESTSLNSVLQYAIKLLGAIRKNSQNS